MVLVRCDDEKEGDCATYFRKMLRLLDIFSVNVGESACDVAGRGSYSPREAGFCITPLLPTVEGTRKSATDDRTRFAQRVLRLSRCVVTRCVQRCHELVREAA